MSYTNKKPRSVNQSVFTDAKGPLATNTAISRQYTKVLKQFYTINEHTKLKHQAQ